MKNKIIAILLGGMLIGAIFILTYKKEIRTNFSTQIQIESNICNLGKISKDSIARYSLKIKNLTNSPLVIYSVQKSSTAILVD